MSAGAPAYAEMLGRARRVLPGGVNSPVRAFRAVGGHPPFVESAAGCRIRTTDGRELVDYVSSWGAILLGHADADVVAAVAEAAAHGTSFGLPTWAEVELAETVCELVASVEMVRWVSSGTEATMSAVRLARAVTGRDAIVKFAGCYHGHADPFLVQAGSGATTFGRPDSPGVPAATVAATHTARFNDVNSVADAMAAEPCAAVIVEAVPGNMGVVAPEPGFLESLRHLCDEHGALLIVDEVMTGFRLAPGGAQELYSVPADLTTMGKVIGHGLPAAAYGGRAELMSRISPAGDVYQAGTLAGNPLAVAAGRVALGRVRDDPSLFDRLEAASAVIEAGIDDAIAAVGAPCRLQRVGSMWTLFFDTEPVREYDDALAADTEAFGRFHRHCLEGGVLLPPSAFEAAFTTLAHADDTAAVAETIRVVGEALEKTVAGA
ncbi:MAG: glutamate-1-semialdehyde 2,1-aminomutase [Acidimicrobiia bacterium]